MKKTARILKRVSIGILALLVLLAAFMFLGLSFGWEIHPVISDSMEPALETGGMVMTKPEKLEDIQVGDMITIHSEEGKIINRVIRIHLIERRIWLEVKADTEEFSGQYLYSFVDEKADKVILYLPWMGFVAQIIAQVQGK